jgi:branched-chain amino acid transport system substrate-binding protein
MIAGMLDRPHIRGALLALWLLTGCSLSPTLVPLPSQVGPAGPHSRGSARQVCEADPFGCVEVAEGDAILIGTALTLSGPNAALGLDSQFGAQVALNLRGTVLGHEVELVNHDDRCSVDGGTAAASLLVELDALVGVIGTSCSSAAEPVVDMLREQGILLVSPSNTAPRLTAGDANGSFYARTAPNDLAQARAMAQFACKEVAVTTAATIGDGGAYAEALQEAFASEFASVCGGTVTEQLGVAGGNHGIEASLEQIAVSNDGAPPDLLYYPLANDLSTMITEKARRTPGLEDMILAGTRVGEDGRVYPDRIDGMYLTAPVLTPAGDFYERAFLEEYRNLSGQDGPIGPFHGHAYDAVNLLLDAVADVVAEEEGVLHIPRTALYEAVLASQAIEGLTGTLTCNAKGDCSDTRVTVSLVQDGDLEPVWP